MRQQVIHQFQDSLGKYIQIRDVRIHDPVAASVLKDHHHAAGGLQLLHQTDVERRKRSGSAFHRMKLIRIDFGKGCVLPFRFSKQGLRPCLTASFGHQIARDNGRPPVFVPLLELTALIKVQLEMIHRTSTPKEYQ